MVCISQVATISANGEREIGELLARTVEKVGKQGVIIVADRNTLDNEIEIVEGMKLSRGYISPNFITDPNTQKSELEHPLILIHEKKITDILSVVRILELALQKRRALLIVAEDIDDDVLAMLVLNKHKAGVKVVESGTSILKISVESHFSSPTQSIEFTIDDGHSLIIPGICLMLAVVGRYNPKVCVSIESVNGLAGRFLGFKGLMCGACHANSVLGVFGSNEEVHGPKLKS